MCCAVCSRPRTTRPASVSCSRGASSACGARSCGKALHDTVERERVLTARALGQREDEFMRPEGARPARCGRTARCRAGPTAAKNTSSAAAPCRRWTWPRPLAPSRTSGSRRAPKGWAWAGCRCSIRPRCRCLLGLPDDAEPIALLCLGPVHDFYEEPMLQRERWARREPLSALVFDERWGQAADLFADAPSTHPSPVEPT
jgi:5,6-dimethylbenzimidazole synthase